MLKKITIIGLGMMGASISLAVKKRMPDVTTVAIVRKERYIEPALNTKIVDEIYANLRPSALEADMIIISVPVLSILKVIEEIKPFLNKKTIITAASTFIFFIGFKLKNNSCQYRFFSLCIQSV